MKLETFFENFERFAGAPNAVGRIRELVFHFAVTGVLADCSASKIASAKEFKESTGRVAESLGVKPLKMAPAKSEQLFSIPSHWRWMRLGEVGVGQTGATPKARSPEATEMTVPFIRPAAIHDGFVEYDGDHVGRKGAKGKTRVAPIDSLLMVCIGTIGKCNLIDRECSFNQQINSLTLCPLVNSKYLLIAVRATFFQDQAWSLSNSTTLSILNKGKWLGLGLPIPPLAEQKRIVAKVDELMALCDRLEAQQQAREAQSAQLARAALARFGGTPTHTNLNGLFHQSFDTKPSELRKAVLDVAIRGLLLAQNPKDEPLTSFLAEHSANRKALKLKDFGDVDNAQAPYQIPHSWAWVKLGNLALTSDSGWSPQCDSSPREGDAWGVLKVSAVSWGAFRPEENKALPAGKDARPACEVGKGDFLLSRANTEELVARSVVVGETPARLMMSDKIVRFRFPEALTKEYLNLANSSEFARSYYAENASGTSSSMKNVGRAVMCGLPIPLPPLAEQKRIVSRVDQLMTLVDQLETQLTTAHETAEKLMDAMVAELTTKH